MAFDKFAIHRCRIDSNIALWRPWTQANIIEHAPYDEYNFATSNTLHAFYARSSGHRVNMRIGKEVLLPRHVRPVCHFSCFVFVPKF